ncbi:hypothetical protein, partial [Vibrio genomosp. F10]|uniref:hypothetical protein n=1 Tax=Vibrio genomosp. F10 TaxID=723171 RepID=UPI00057271F9
MSSYEVTFEARPSHKLFMFADMSLNLAKNASNDDLRQYYLVTGIIHAAFSFESMIDYFGNALIENWECLITKKLRGRKETDKYLFKTIGLANLSGSKKYQDLHQYFALRDFFAHSKSTYETRVVNIDDCLTEESKVDKLYSIGHSKFDEPSISTLQNFIELIGNIENEIESNALYPQTHINAGENISESPLGWTVFWSTPTGHF